MEGLFYYHNSDGITYLSFYPDGRVISYSIYNRFDQYFHSFPDLWVENDDAHYSRGFYQLDFEGGINIFVKGEYGKMIFQGTILDQNTIELSYRCPVTNFRKSATFFRFSSQPNLIHIELSDTYSN